MLLLPWKETEANIHKRECLAWVLHCFVAYKTVVSAQPWYSIGSDCARGVWEVDEIQSWQHDKSLILTCDMKKGPRGGVRWSHTEGRKGHALVKVKDGETFTKGETETQRHISEPHD